MSIKLFYSFVGLVAFFILVFSVASAATNSNAPLTSTSDKEPSTGNPEDVTPTIIAMPIPYCWVSVAPANPGSGNATLNGIDGLSSNDIWAVGAFNDDPPRSVAMHWNGSAWTSYPLPENIPTYRMTAVSMVSSNDVWAITGVNVHTNVLLHWNGTQWSVAAPDLNTDTYGYPIGLAALASDNVIVVTNGSCGEECNALHVNRWDGANWSILYSYGCYWNCQAWSFYAGSANDIWVGGNQLSDGGPYRLLIHWDGAQWTRLQAPEVTGGGTIKAVGGSAPNDVWVDADNTMYHWNGSTWTPYSINYYPLHKIIAISPNDAWAVGGNTILHWNGNQWGRSDNATGQTSVNDITAVSTTNIWAVGASDNSSYHGMMIAHYSPSCVSTPVPTATITPIPPTATRVPPRCPGEHFTDVCPGDYFYQHVLDLNNLGILSGYNSTPPCESPAHVPCFKPNGLITRGQMAKIISNAAGFSEPVNEQWFTDVPPDSTFYDFVERLVQHGITVGYPCYTDPGEPCDAENRPYYRVNANVNRAQMAKFTALAFNFQDTPTTQTFEDVVPDNHFYPFIENLASRSIIGGYPCGSPGEPCIPPDNLPYYRYATLVTRAQAAKIVNLARTYQTPSPTSTITETPATITPTPTPQK